MKAGVTKPEAEERRMPDKMISPSAKERVSIYNG